MCIRDRIKVEVEIPHLLNLQVDSYRKFMQEGRTERLPDEGLSLIHIFVTEIVE